MADRYGLSTKTPSPDGSHLANSKQAVAANVIQLVDLLLPGLQPKIVVVGHDRGARVGYRLAKDYRERVVGVCLQGEPPPSPFRSRSLWAHGLVDYCY